MYGLGKYSSTESASCIQINEISKGIKDLILKSDPEIPRNASGQKYRNNDILQNKVNKAMHDLEIEGQKFDYYTFPNHLGGTRWFFKCPGCSKQLLKLFKPTLEPEKKQVYMCSDCHMLKSPSALYGPSSKYRDIVKPQRRMDKLRRLIKNSRKATDEELRAYMEEYEKIKKEMECSPTWLKMQFAIVNDGFGAHTAF